MTLQAGRREGGEWSAPALGGPALLSPVYRWAGEGADWPTGACSRERCSALVLTIFGTRLTFTFFCRRFFSSAG